MGREQINVLCQSWTVTKPTLFVHLTSADVIVQIDNAWGGLGWKSKVFLNRHVQCATSICVESVCFPTAFGVAFIHIYLM